MRMSEGDYEALLAKRRADRPVKPAKYRNTKKEVNGILFDSTKEARRYVDLLNWQMSGQITKLRTQVEFKIVVEGMYICSYFADFTYEKDGEQVIEDVKSKVTRKLPVYQLKRKLMLAHGLEIQEI